MLTAKERGYAWRKSYDIPKPRWYLFGIPGFSQNKPYRWGVSRPRVRGGYVIMMKRLIITPTLDEVEVYQCVRKSG